jgi:superfamily II DNA/RNA helicase
MKSLHTCSSLLPFTHAFTTTSIDRLIPCVVSLQSNNTSKSSLFNLFSSYPSNSKCISTSTSISKSTTSRCHHRRCHRHHIHSLLTQQRCKGSRQFSTQALQSTSTVSPIEQIEEIFNENKVVTEENKEVTEKIVDENERETEMEVHQPDNKVHRRNKFHRHRHNKFHRHRRNKVYPVTIPTKNEQLFETFLDFSPSLSDTLISALKDYSIKTPTAFQCEAYKTITAASNTLLAAEGGSGKTLAYMLPILNDLLTRSRPPANTSSFSESDPVTPRNPRFPRALIIAPTYKQCAQIQTLIKALAGDKLRAAILTSKGRFPSITLYDADILICTGLSLRGLADSSFSFVDTLEYIVVDDADYVFNSRKQHLQTFLSVIQRTREDVKIAHKLKCVFVTTSLSSATRTSTSSLYKYFLSTFQERATVISASLYTIPPAVHHKWIPVSDEHKYNKEVMKILSAQPRGSRVLIVTNGDFQHLYDLLSTTKGKKKITVQSYSRRWDRDLRMEILKAWNQTIGDSDALRIANPDSVNVLIISEQNCHGLDFANNISTLISVGTPYGVSDFLDRVSCLGRLSRFSFKSPLKAVHIGTNLNRFKKDAINQLRALNPSGNTGLWRQLSSVKHSRHSRSSSSLLSQTVQSKITAKKSENGAEPSSISNSTDQSLQNISSIISKLTSHYSDNNVEALRLSRLKELLSSAEVTAPGFLNSLLYFALSKMKTH